MAKQKVGALGVTITQPHREQQPLLQTSGCGEATRPPGSLHGWVGCSCTQPKASSPVNLPHRVAVRTEENHPCAWGAVSAQQVGTHCYRDSPVLRELSVGDQRGRQRWKGRGARRGCGGEVAKGGRRGSEKGGGESLREDRGKEEEGQGRVPSSK